MAIQFDGTVQVSFVAVNGTITDLLKISDEFNCFKTEWSESHWDFNGCPVDGEKLYGFYVDELTLQTPEGLAFYFTDNIVSVRRITFPNDRVFLIDGCSEFERRPNLFGGAYSVDYCRLVGGVFLPLFVKKMQEMELATVNSARMKYYMLSSDFSQKGLQLLRQHYYPLTIRVLQTCKELPHTTWSKVIREMIESAAPNFLHEENET